MTAKNHLTTAPPFEVEQCLRRLGANLRAARLRRNLTIAEVARKIGAGPRPIADAEQGKITSAAAVYIALLWAYDLLGPMEDIADPALDREGLASDSPRLRARARGTASLDDNF